MKDPNQLNEPSGTSRSIARMMLAVLALTCTQLAGAAGLLTPKQSQQNAPQIRQHHVAVTVEDGYAITSIDQTFFNPNAADIEAVYAFPVPHQASVGEFTYWIDGKPVTGEVVPKKRAREIYNSEKSQGRETAITEKNEYKTFSSTVYPVRGQQEVRIRLVYIQPLNIDSGVGRYVYPLENGGVDEEQLAFWSYNDIVTEAFSFDFKLRSSYPVDDVRLPQHGNIGATKHSDTEWTANLSNAVQAANEAGSTMQATQIQRLDKDIVVYWRLAQGLPGGVDMVTHKAAGSREGTFMLTLTPGDDLQALSGGRDFMFILDFSGSMSGKYASLIDGVGRGLGKLRPTDRFRVVLFNDNAWEVTNGWVDVTESNVNHYMQKLDHLQPGGGTNLYDGLSLGIKNLDADRSSAVLLVTDGVANVGKREKKDFLKMLEQHDLRLFTFVMGNSANRPLLDGMTKVSQGFSMPVSNSDDILGNVALAANKLQHEALRDIELEIDGIKVRDLTPESIGSLYRGQQLTVFGHFWGEGEADLTLKGKSGAEKIVYEAKLNFTDSSLNPELERLWAFAAIEDLQNKLDYLGEDADAKQAIVDIATQYGLVTNYTSMVVVRDEMKSQYKLGSQNADRVKAEQNARLQRDAAPVQDNRQQAGPALNTTRAYPDQGGGAGSMGWLGLVLLLPILLTFMRSNLRFNRIHLAP